MSFKVKMSDLAENEKIPPTGEGDTDPLISREKRVRSLSEKGTALFESTCKLHEKRIDKVLESIEELASVKIDTITEIEVCDELKVKILHEFNSYRSLTKEYRDFLVRTNTAQSDEILQTLDQADSKYYLLSETVMTDLNSHKAALEQSVKAPVKSNLASSKSSKASAPRSLKSRVSYLSGGSTKSSRASSKVSAAMAMARASAEAAKAKLEFTEMEVSLLKKQAQLTEQEQLSKAKAIRQKAELKADLQLLGERREAAAASAQARALEAFGEGDLVSQSSEFETANGLPASHIDPVERTKEYVKQQAEHIAQRSNVDPPVIKTEPGYVELACEDLNLLTLQKPTPPNPVLGPDNSAYPPLSANAPEFKPMAAGTPVNPQQPGNSNLANDLTKFLLKKDLCMSRLFFFTDHPESYAVWKNSFKGIVEELGCTPVEELDLLVKWLGPESKKYAMSIRTSNASCPSRGLERLWERLDERYGCPEMVEAALKNKLANFPKLTMKDSQRLYDLADILSEVESAMENPLYKPLLSYYNTSSGINPIVAKLPYQLHEKWTNRAVSHKNQHKVSFPPFTVFAQFVREMSRIKNDPGFMYELPSENNSRKYVVPSAPTPQRHRPALPSRPLVAARKTDLDQTSLSTQIGPELCPLHRTRHSLNKCKAFKAKPMEERRRFLKDNRICFKCCDSDKHLKRDCTSTIKCEDCGQSHPTALHINNLRPDKPAGSPPSEAHGGEGIKPNQTPAGVATKCTEICGSKFHGKSCAKIILVHVYPEGHPESAQRVYAIIDDQSNRSLARSEFFSLFNIESESFPYKLSSCSGLTSTSGRRAKGFVIESIDRSSQLQLPTLIECDEIPNLRSEIPTPEVASMYPHLHDISSQIPSIDEDAHMLILIGRDLPEAHHVLGQRIGNRGTPYAQCLSLGWVIVGEACLGKVHMPDVITTNKTHILRNGRASICMPCDNELYVKESVSDVTDSLGSTVFEKTKDDDKMGLSVEDRKFLHLMEEGFQKTPEGNWIAPLPFREGRERLPNNKSQALRRAKTLDNSLRKDPLKKSHFVAFMKKVIDNGHAELAPPLEEDEECWYLPIFGVYHPKKPDQIRGVFDSSAKFNDVSLNSVLMSGPNLTNSLLGILLRFRSHPVAVTADIEQMFYGFLVREDHRNFLRFLWYRDNNPDKDLVEYRMRAHVFGNSPSPAIATYGLLKIATASEKQFGSDVKEFIERNFYVDDGVASLPTVEHAVGLIRKTQEACKKEGNLRLHKIASNKKEVMTAFPPEDLAKDLKGLDFACDDIPVQRSLGLSWLLKSDAFTYQVSTESKPYTKRGVLSVVNSIYDPLGFVAPVTIEGKLFLRNAVSGSSDWDEPLPEEYRSAWEHWRESLQCLQQHQIPRMYATASNDMVIEKEVHIFSDASEKAIAAAAYLVTTTDDGGKQTGFILGKAKVAPLQGHTIPRLELCAAVLAVEIAQTVCEHLDLQSQNIFFYTDSKVVLGYIHNQTRRFYVYVSNRVDRILKASVPSQWSYVQTDKNPADCGTRGVPATQMDKSMWLLGPSFVTSKTEESEGKAFPLVNPDEDQDIRPAVKVMKSCIDQNHSLGSHRFEKFSSLKRLVETIAFLRHIATCFNSEDCHGWHSCSKHKTVDQFEAAKQTIIKVVQSEQFGEEISCIKERKKLPQNSPLLALNPFLDSFGVLRVGGRLNKATLQSAEKNPIILSAHQHISTLLVLHYHSEVKHQGRHFTEGAVRAAGYWIIGGKRLISSLIHKCVKCRRMRGKQMSQQMSDLPQDRLQPGPPFSSVGVDTFGPWEVATRRSRGGVINSKRWGILFTCLSTRAVHIEVVEELSSSSFINALRRFMAIRGSVKIFRSDRGTNFIGATDALLIDAIHVEDGPVKDFLYSKGTTWLFNAPHASHMGGVWERMIGVTRRILDSMLLDCKRVALTHEVLVTFMAEACAIINSRPLTPVSSDPECTEILTPSTLLTQKTDSGLQPLTEFDPKNMYRAQWQRVQTLADIFWTRWKNEFLHTMQQRCKWQGSKPDLKP